MSERDPRTKEQSSTHDTERNIQPSEEPKNKENVSALKSLGWLDRFLAVWIFLAMVVGIILGNFVPSTGPALEKGKFVGVSVPIAVGLLVMMYPILCKVRYESLHEIFSQRDVWKQILFSIFINWIIAPFLMVAHSPVSSNIQYSDDDSSAWRGPSSQTSPNFASVLSS
ncbi:arsenicals resistance [Fusarium oxysporum]|nr:arsenicals resistance [Fusarium oxysporum]KAJ4095716.1 arsenicals resistance [Fusarium oxysporum]KAJ4107448.1 arsenicals resistance [Fusarium oxysporum]